MIDVSREKLCILPLYCANNSVGMVNFQRFLLFGLVAKLNLFTDITCKSIFLKEDVNGFEANVIAEQKLQGLYNYAQNNRLRYILTGAISPRFDLDQTVRSMRLSMRLYDAKEKRFLLDVNYNFSNFLPGQNHLKNLWITVSDMNYFLNWLSVLLVNILMQDRPFDGLASLINHQLTQYPDSIRQLVLAELEPIPEERIKIYDALLKADPNLEIGYVYLGKMARLNENPEKSIWAYEQALKVSQCSNSVKASYATEIGIGLAHLERHKEATQWWIKAIELAPSFMNPYMNVALTFEAEGDLDQAEKFYLKAQAISPEDPRTYFSLGTIYQKIHHWKSAVDQYDRYLSRNQNDPWCHNEVATCYLQLNDHKNAVKHLEKSKYLDPSGEYGQYAELLLSNLSHV
ncbi:MAG: tetratricopeptide repeat protein [Cyanobacteria bacterium]|nr:tetratricopeptide repeat protein [Cyanobacteriota bacterium]